MENLPRFRIVSILLVISVTSSGFDPDPAMSSTYACSFRIFDAIGDSSFALSARRFMALMARSGAGLSPKLRRTHWYMSAALLVSPSLHRNLWYFWSSGWRAIWLNIFSMSPANAIFSSLQPIKTLKREFSKQGPFSRASLSETPSTLAAESNTNLTLVVLSGVSTSLIGRYQAGSSGFTSLECNLTTTSLSTNFLTSSLNACNLPFFSSCFSLDSILW